VNSVSLAGRVASLLPNTTAEAMDSPQACLHSCEGYCGYFEFSGHRTNIYHLYLCCASGCWSQGCQCDIS
jgi:hypothetical protein